MNKMRLLWVLIAVLALSALVAACTPTTQEQIEGMATQAAPMVNEAATQAAAAATAAAPMINEAATQAAAAATAAAPMVNEAATKAAEMAGAFAPLSVAAENCDYGGKILSIEAVDELTVRFNLCKPDPAFYAKIAFVPFAIQPAEWIAAAAQDKRLLEQPIGTGPYRLETWARGEQIIFKRFEDYWGAPAIAETAVLRWNQEGASRLLELQAGSVDMITNVSPDDYATVEANPNLALVPNPNPNIFYLAMINTLEPFNNPDVRKALAMGIDRQRIVDNFYPEGSTVADYFTPCSIPNGCAGETWYGFDAQAARDMLAAAGFPDGFKTKIYYRQVFRVYLPEPSLVAVELQTQLKQNLNIDAEVVVLESGEFIQKATTGSLDGLYLLGWGADYPHATNFLDYHFGKQNPQFGATFPEIYTALEQASQIADAATAEPLYVQANNAIRELVPMIPIAHGASADAALIALQGAYAPPFGSMNFALVDPGKDTLVYMQNAEPISLYCADETDGESLRPCEQVLEGLLRYKTDSGDTEPALATSCTGNADSTVFTCTLRSGVKFHDGSMLDANDVVVSWAAGIDAKNPYHIGNTGTFDYFSYLWDGLINADE